MHTYANDCTLSKTASRPQLSDSSADSDTFLAVFFYFIFSIREALDGKQQQQQNNC
jgi:hypothetical protein